MSGQQKQSTFGNEGQPSGRQGAETQKEEDFKTGGRQLELPCRKTPRVDPDSRRRSSALTICGEEELQNRGEREEDGDRSSQSGL